MDVALEERRMAEGSRAMDPGVPPWVRRRSACGWRMTQARVIPCPRIINMFHCNQKIHLLIINY